MLKARLDRIVDAKSDSLRYYFLGANWRSRVGHVGARLATDIDAPLVP